MRIDAYHAISQVYQSNQVNSKAVQKERSGESDSFEISDFGKTLQVAKQAVAAAPEVREDKVADMKERLASGTYHVSAEEVSEKLVNEYFSGLF